MPRKRSTRSDEAQPPPPKKKRGMPRKTSTRRGDEAQPVPRKKKKGKSRAFRGNQYVEVSSKKQEAKPVGGRATPSTGGGRATPSTSAEGGSADSTGYRLIDIEVLTDFIQTFPCRTEGCGSTDYSVSEQRVGLSFTLQIACNACGANFKLSNTKLDHLNMRFALSMFSIGCHFEQGKKFLSNMNMPPPVSDESFAKYRDKIADATERAAKASMSKAAREFSSTLKEGKAVVSCDGTWQRRGFVSKNGVATVLSSGKADRAKVLDVHVSSNHCDACLKAKKRYQGKDLDDWQSKHKGKCSKNHEGTSGQMESLGMLKIFRRSQERYGLKYLGYLGDGDSKSFHTVSTATPPVYDKPIRKLECCGHVQKRMGKRLMDKVAENKNKEFREGGKTYKGIGGKAGLTQQAIKRIQGHYGGAIRGNVGDKKKMKKAIMAIWEHRDKCHKNCGPWCPSHKGIEGLAKANANAFPKFVVKEIKPVFDDLSTDELLDKCLHGGTQNVNEAFNSMIWKRCPKTVFVGRTRLEIAVYDAVISFNEGERGRLSIFGHLNLKVGHHMETAFDRLDKMRMKRYERQTSESAKKERKKRKLAMPSTKGGDSSYGAGAH